MNRQEIWREMDSRILVATRGEGKWGAVFPSYLRYRQLPQQFTVS